MVNFNFYFDLRFLQQINAALEARAKEKGLFLDPTLSSRRRAALVREIVRGEPPHPDCWQKLWLLIHDDPRWRGAIGAILRKRNVEPVEGEDVTFEVLDQLFEVTIRLAGSWSETMSEAMSLAAKYQGLFQLVAAAVDELGASLPDDAKSDIALRKRKDLMDGLASELGKIFERSPVWPDAWQELDRLLFVEQDEAIGRLFELAGWNDKKGQKTPAVKLQLAVLRVAYFVASQSQFSWDGRLRLRIYELTTRELQRRAHALGEAAMQEAPPAQQRRLIDVPIEAGVLIIEASIREVPYGVARLAVFTTDAKPAEVVNMLVGIPRDPGHAHTRRYKLPLEDLRQIQDGGEGFVAYLCPATEDNEMHFPLDAVRALLDVPPACTDQALAADIQILIERLERHHDGGHEMR